MATRLKNIVSPSKLEGVPEGRGRVLMAVGRRSVLKTPLFLYIVCAMLMALPASLQGQNADRSKGCPKVGLVLSGGGAKGAAHIGVLKYMEEIGIPVSYVTGTSMGSILGGLYALGYSPEEMEELISGIDWPLYITGKLERRFLSQRRRKVSGELLLNIPYGKFTRRDDAVISAMPLGAVEGDNLLNLFNCLSVGFQDSMSFDSMPIPFACVATDLMTGKPMILRGGEFGRAIRSSMSIPIFFSPVEWGDHLLADGGITNNLPVDVCREMGADVIIGLEVATDLADDPDDLRSVTRQIQQYLSIMTNRGLEEHRQQCQIYINPDVSGVNMLSFDAESIADLIRRGYEAAKAHEAEFLQLKASLTSQAPAASHLPGGEGETRWEKRARAIRPGDSLTVDGMEILGMDDDENRFLAGALSPIEGKKITLHDVEELVHTLQGTGIFHSVNFKLIPASPPNPLSWEERGSVNSDVDYHYTLQLSVTPELPYRMGVGLRYDSEESATLLLHASWNALKLKGFNARFDLGLKYNLWAEAHIGWLIMGLGDLGIDARTHHATFRCSNRPFSSMDLRERKLRFGITTVHLPSLELSLGLSQDLNTREPDVAGEAMERGFATGLYFKTRSDTRDADAFATDGYLLDIEGNLRQESDHLLQNGEPLIADLAFTIEGYISSGRRLTFIPGIHSRVMWGYEGDELWYNNLAGGNMRGRYLSHQLPFVGLTNTIELGPMAFVYSLETRYRILDKTYLSLHASLLAHSSRSEMDHIATDGYVATNLLGLAASVGYSSLLGPISLMVGTNSYDRSLHGYLNIGFEF